MMMKMLNETPLKALQKVATDDKGRPYKIYKYLVPERLKILDSARQEVALLSKAGDYVGADGRVAQGEGTFGDIGDSKVLGIGQPLEEEDDEIESRDQGEEAA